MRVFLFEKEEEKPSGGQVILWRGGRSSGGTRTPLIETWSGGEAVGMLEMCRRSYFRSGCLQQWCGGERVGGGRGGSYLDHAAIDGQGGADHVHIGRGGGALALGQTAGRGGARRGVVEGVRGGITVGGATRERERLVRGGLHTD